MVEKQSVMIEIKTGTSKKLNECRELKTPDYRERIALFLMLFLIPSLSYAYGGSGSDEVLFIVQNLCNYLSGVVAQAIGILAIIFMGYRTLSGRMDWRLGATISIGLGLIIGGAYYGGMLLGKN